MRGIQAAPPRFFFSCYTGEIMIDEAFEQLVREGILAVPEQFRKLMNNVEIVIEDKPTREQQKKLKLGKGYALYGLYEGIPRTARGAHYSLVLPDKITIFKNAILDEAARQSEGNGDYATTVSEIVRETVWHEIAHHFGYTEGRVREAERKRRRRKLD